MKAALFAAAIFLSGIAVVRADTLPAEMGSEDRINLESTDISADLDGQTGKMAVSRVENIRLVANQANLDAEVAGGNYSSVFTGANSIASSALSGMNGIGTVVQNSGNQVVIQNSTIFNVSLY